MKRTELISDMDTQAVKLMRLAKRARGGASPCPCSFFPNAASLRPRVKGSKAHKKTKTLFSYAPSACAPGSLAALDAAVPSPSRPPYTRPRTGRAQGTPGGMARRVQAVLGKKQPPTPKGGGSREGKDKDMNKHFYAGHSYMGTEFTFDSGCWKLYRFATKSARSAWLENNERRDEKLVAEEVTRVDAARIAGGTRNLDNGVWEKEGDGAERFVEGAW